MHSDSFLRRAVTNITSSLPAADNARWVIFGDGFGSHSIALPASPPERPCAHGRTCRMPPERRCAGAECALVMVE